MSLYKIIFSPTGGTNKAADAVASALNEEYITVDLSDPNFKGIELNADDTAVIAVPSFGGRVPKTAAERLKKIKGNGSAAVTVCVYGNRDYDDTLLELNDICGVLGFKVAGSIAAIAQHSIAPQFGAGRPDEEDLNILRCTAKSIEKKIKNGELNNPPAVPGKRPYMKHSDMTFVPKADSNCNKCGLCAQKCPVEAIDENNLKSANKKKCISCMRCVAICPQKARKIPSLIVKTVSLMLKKSSSARKENQLFM